MKLTKKVLSLILAAALLVGTVAIAANAAELLTEYEGSVSTYTITADKTEVKPGETFTVTVTMDCNYYLGPVGCELILWTDGVFSALGDNYTTGTVANHYTLKPTNPAKATSFPAAYTTGYTGVQFLRNYNASNVDVVMTTEEDNVLYKLTFTVNEDATVGTVAKIFLPAESVLSASATGRTQMIYQAVNNASDAFSSGTNASKYAETVNCGSLDIKIVGEEVEEPTTEEPTTEEPTTEAPVQYADLTALKAAIADAANADTANCTSASVAEFEAALAAANALNVEGTLASEQDAVNAAAQRLTAAIKGLTKLGACNYDALDAAIAEYEALVADKAGYTTSTWAAYEAAYNEAKAVERNMVADEAGANQAKIDAAAQALNDAKVALAPLGACDYEALDAAIAEYEALVADKANYGDTWAAYEAAYNAAKAIARDLLADEAGANQAKIDAAAKALADAKAALELLPADYTAVEDAKASIPADLSIYTSASVKAVSDAVDAVVYGLDITKQADVDAMAKAIVDAVKALAPLAACDYTALDAQIEAYEALVKANYKPASWTASNVDAAYATATGIARDLLADEAGENQAAINAAAAALETAIAALEEVEDKTALATAIARAKAYVADTYTPDSWTAADLATVIAAAEAVYANADASADDVAGAIAAIEAAEAKLVIKADKATLLEALQAAQAKAEDDYTPNSWVAADLANVMAAAQVVYDDDNATAEEIAAQVAALNAAMAKLVAKADKTKLDEVLVESSILDTDNTTADSFDAWLKAHNAALAVQEDANATQEEVDKAEADLRAAIDALVWLGKCDYSKLEAALNAAAALVEADYTTSSWAAANVAAAVAAAEEIAKDLIADEAGENQAMIDAAAEAINDAIAKLEKKADMTALQAAVDAAAKVAEEYATVDSWTTYAQAKAEAEDILANAADTGVSVQDAVDAAAKALNDANDALVEEPADYTAVEEALAKVPADMSGYTQASVKKVNAAVNAVVYGLGKSKQADVDAMAKAIEDAVAGLTESKAAITNLDVDLSDYTKKETRQYAFTVTGAPAKIQLKGANGSTATFDRYHRNITIVSYNANGEVINYVDEAPAYEVWTIALALGEGTFTAKAKFNYGWEPYTYEFTVDIVDPADEGVKFVAKDSASDEEAGKALVIAKGGVAEITIVAPASATKAQLVFASGSTATYTKTNATVVNNGDGTCTWTILRAFKNAGTGTMDLKLKDAKGWYAAVTDTITVEVVK